MSASRLSQKRRTACAMESARLRSKTRRPRVKTSRPETGTACRSSSGREVGVANLAVPYRRDWRFLATIVAAANYLPRSQTQMRKALHRHSARANANGDGEPLNLRPKPKARTRQVGPCAYGNNT